MQENKTKIAGLILLSGITLTLFSGWQPSGETWGYWYFARVFAETGKFVILDRSPLYTLYLNLFRWIGYPHCVTVEYIVTSVIVSVSLVVLFRKYMGLIWSSFAVALWLPYLQTAEPPVQKLALAFSCLAVASRKERMISYSLLLVAYMFRSTYIIFLIAFGLCDLVNFLRHKKYPYRWWFVVATFMLLVWFRCAQSPNPWNNAWFTSTRWYPTNGKSHAQATFIHNYNWAYIQEKYGSFKDKDFYFTNHELFNGATTITGAVIANPQFIARHLLINAKTTIKQIYNFTMFPKTRIRNMGFVTLISALLMYGALRAGKKNMLIFIIGNMLLICTSAVALPKGRYFVCLVPLLILSSWWWSRRFKKCWVAVPLALMLFSNGTGVWKGILQHPQPIRGNPAYKAICRAVDKYGSVMSLESTFVGAFTNVALDRNYDVWEIPPFKSDYTLDKVGCVLVSKALRTGYGPGISFQVRYDNYIKSSGRVVFLKT